MNRILLSIASIFGLVLAGSLQKTSTAQARKDDKIINVCLVSGSLEYESDKTMPKLQEYLEKNYPVKCYRAFRKTDTDIPGLEKLDDCDVMVLFTRRLEIEGEQLERVKKFCRSGKGIVGIRTASHAFQKWKELDKEVFAGNYKNHYPEGPLTTIEQQGKHPILEGVRLVRSKGSLYKNPDLKDEVHVLLTGSIEGKKKEKITEPIAWTREHGKGRVFYTSLGHQTDFEDENFLRMLGNAVKWTSKK